MNTESIKQAFNRLNNEQKESVRDDSPTLLILAGAGTGKTTTLTVKIARHLLKHKLSPREIVGLTFTNKAGAELKQRVAKLIGESYVKDLFMGTFHSFCLRILRRNHSAAGLPQHFQILDPDDCKRLMTTIWKADCDNAIEVSKKSEESPRETPDEVKARFAEYKNAIKITLQLLSEAKSLNKGVDHAIQSINELVYTSNLCPDVAEYATTLVTKFEDEKERLHALDFDDLLIRTSQLLKDNNSLREGISNQIKALLIDEFQDTNVVQYELMKLLTNKNTYLTVVGDEDQLIYEWRGAVLRNILDFCKNEGGKCIKLVENYRSTASILNAANEVISNNKNRYGKTLVTSNPTGKPIQQSFFATAYDEAKSVTNEIQRLIKSDVPLKQIAVLYRNKSMNGALSLSLHKENIPSVVYGGLSFWERKETKDTLAFLKWVNSDLSEMSIVRILDRLKIGFGSKKHVEIRELAERNNLPYGEALEAYANQGKETKLKSALKNIISTKNLAKTAYIEKGIGSATSTIIVRSGLLDAYKKTDDNESFTERLEHLQQVVEMGELFSHDEKDENGEQLDDLTVFLSNADLQVESNSQKKTDSISLMTIHASKGLEFDYVFIIGAEDANFPSPMRQSSSEIEEERRLAYVAITRGRTRVWISGARLRLNKTSGQISIFAREISTRYKIYEDLSSNSYW